MINKNSHIIQLNTSLNEALNRLNHLGNNGVLFVINDNKELIGSVSDGDIRRGLIEGRTAEDNIFEFSNKNPCFLRDKRHSLNDIIDFRKKSLKIIPILNEDDQIVDILNFSINRSYLPIDALIMAGGLGSRLKPLTDNTPKSLLKVGEKAIIDYSIENLSRYGVRNIFISLRHLGEQIEDHINNGNFSNHIKTVWESKPLGTIGAASLIDTFENDIILITNSDILTNINYENFVLDFIESGADMSVIGIPYQVKVPYAVMDVFEGNVVDFSEKPSFTFYTNGGIYLIKKKLLNVIPKNAFYNTTDLMNYVISSKGVLRSYPMLDYWLDIGRLEDYRKANKEIKNIDFL